MISLKPGIMLAVSTQITPGPTYERHELDTGDTPANAEVSKWETKKTIVLPEEYAESVRVRNKARSLLRQASVWTPLGVLMCPTADLPELDVKEQEARNLVRTFNEGAARYRVTLRTVRGQIALDDAQAAASIAGELATLLSQMETAAKLTQEAARLGRGEDVKAQMKILREASYSAKAMSKLLDDEPAGRISIALTTARKLARQVLERVDQAGDDLAAAGHQIAEVLSEQAMAPISAARVVFLSGGEVPPEASEVVDGKIGDPWGFDPEDPPFVDALEEVDRNALEREIMGLFEPITTGPMEPDVLPERRFIDDPVPDEEPDPEAVEALRAGALARLGLDRMPGEGQPSPENLAAAQGLLASYRRPVLVQEED